MPSRRCWSRTVGAQRGTRVRVYERTPGGALYVAVWKPGEGERRKSLRHKDRDRALEQARDLSRLLPSGDLDDSVPLTLGTLLERYLTENRYNRDGSLKTDRYMRNCRAGAKNLKSWFGATTQVALLTPDRMDGYVLARRTGKISGRSVRVRSPQMELSMLKSAMRWATGVFENGKPLLDRSPLATYSPPRERDPRRPMISQQTVRKLMDVAQGVDPILPLLITLMDTTGRRLSSVLGLRWDDFDFEEKTIRFRAELDKRRKTWTAPLPRRAERELRRCQARSPTIGSVLLFPSPKDAHKPVSIYLARSWLEQAYEHAGLKREKGGLWHPFRRKWATERKLYPLSDVAAAGGWSDTQTLLLCYQQPDPKTLRRVMDLEETDTETRSPSPHRERATSTK